MGRASENVVQSYWVKSKVMNLWLGAPPPAGFPPGKTSEQLLGPLNRAASEKKQPNDHEHLKHSGDIHSCETYFRQARLVDSNLFLSSACNIRAHLTCGAPFNPDETTWSYISVHSFYFEFSHTVTNPNPNATFEHIIVVFYADL